MRNRTLLIWSSCFLAVGVTQVGCGGYVADPPGGGSTTDGTATGETTGSGGGTDTATGGAGATTGSGGDGSGAGATTGSGGRIEDPEPPCENVSACGGDPTGVWFAVASCLPVSGVANLSPFGIGCSEAPISGKLDVTGNWALTADGKINDTTKTTGELVIGLGKDCLDVSGTTVACSDVAGPLASIGFTALSCVDADSAEGGCTCTGTIDQAGGAGFVNFDATTEGIYTIMENVITTTNYIDVEYDFCVEGEFMYATPTTMPANLGTTNGTIVFRRQP